MLVIYRTVAYVQDVEIDNQDGFYPTVIEQQLDRIVMQIQQVAEQVSTALLIPPTVTISDDELITLIIQLGAQQAQLDIIADWISGASALATLDITGFVFATGGQTVVPVTDGYVLGTLTVRRNGIEQLQGTPIGTGVTDFDCQATDGVNIVFPSSVLAANDCISWTKKRNFDVANIPAEGVSFIPSGGIVATNVQAALVELDTEKVPTTRQITTTGLLTGGGALSGDRVFAVPKATSAEVIAGVDDTKATTPLGVRDAILASGGTPAVLLINSGVTTAQAVLDLALSSGWRGYQLIIDQLEPVTANQPLLARLSFNGGATYVVGASDYKFTGRYDDEGGATAGWNSTGTTSFILGRTQPALAGNNSRLNLSLSAISSGYWTRVDWLFNHDFTGPLSTMLVAGGKCMGGSTTPTHIRLLYTSGNIAAGARWQLYGLRN
jgi:hypothetical protein